MSDTLSSEHGVVRGLVRYTDWWQPSTASVILVGHSRRARSLHDGLHPGLIDTLDERSELRRRFLLLPERDRLVLILWYLRELAVGEIALELGVSRRQCFRLRGSAIRRIVQLGDPQAAA